MSDTNYYVYHHIDPRTGELVYIGKGTKERAWAITTRKKKNPLHYAWLLELYTAGYRPPRWVKIVADDLNNADACALEAKQLYDVAYPRFNFYYGEKSHQAKLKEADVDKIYALRDEGKTIYDIAPLFGISPAQVWNISRGSSWARKFSERVQV